MNIKDEKGNIAMIMAKDGYGWAFGDRRKDLKKIVEMLKLNNIVQKSGKS